MHNDEIKGEETGGTRPTPLQFDPDKYRSEIESFDITEVQKQELLATLWLIMRGFVEPGFSVDVCAALLDEPVSLSGGDEVR